MDDIKESIAELNYFKEHIFKASKSNKNPRLVAFHKLHVVQQTKDNKSVVPLNS